MTPGLRTTISPSSPGLTTRSSCMMRTETPRQAWPTERNFPDESRRSGVKRGQIATARVASASP
jgi:hypothetical protein